MGLDRITMLKYGIPDLRTFFSADLRWLKHYGFLPLDIPSLAGGLSSQTAQPLAALFGRTASAVCGRVAFIFAFRIAASIGASGSKPFHARGSEGAIGDAERQ